MTFSWVLVGICVIYGVRLWFNSPVHPSFMPIIAGAFCAVLSFTLVLALEYATGPITLKAGSLNFEGASGPIILWCLCFFVYLHSFLQYMRVHFIAVGGSAMHNLAIALHNKGFKVSGSDDVLFEPSKSRLSKYGILPQQEGWYPETITANLDAVILGMHARVDNPELLKAQELGRDVGDLSTLEE